MTESDTNPGAEISHASVTYEKAIDPASLAYPNGIDAVEADQTELVFPGGIDPENIPDCIEELYVARGRTSHRRYHLDPRCDRLKQEPKDRRPVIGADWYPPCDYCVCDEKPLLGMTHDYGTRPSTKLRSD